MIESDIHATPADSASLSHLPASQAVALEDSPASAPDAPDTFLSTFRWLGEGLRAAFLLRPRTVGRQPGPGQLLLIGALAFAAEAAMSRLQIAGPAHFDVQAWAASWWTLGPFTALAWWAFPRAQQPGAAALAARHAFGDVAAWMALWLGASLPLTLVFGALAAALGQGWISPAVFSSPWLYWGWYAVFLGWSFALAFTLIVRFAGWTGRSAVFMLAVAAATGLTIWQFNARAWQEDDTGNTEAVAERPRLHLTQQTLEEQQALWQKTVAAIAPQRPGVTDVYGLVFAPYADEDVFLRESTLVSDVLVRRFDAGGRVIHLLNHGSTTATHPWATRLNLQRAIEALARRMDRERDVLVVYLTSHGASNFKLAASHWPLEVEPLTPAELRQALDQAGIRHRVIAISACYAGGWIDPLASNTTLVMTAADATHTSYGCGSLSELTFFGRAMFDEQLRQTHSFEKAFAQAVPLIRQREIDAGKPDGFSNPQIRVGAGIAPVLRGLEQRLDALAQTAPPARAPASAVTGKTRS